jgi:hypothetical protein
MLRSIVPGKRIGALRCNTPNAQYYLAPLITHDIAGMQQSALDRRNWQGHGVYWKALLKGGNVLPDHFKWPSNIE